MTFSSREKLVSLRISQFQDLIHSLYTREKKIQQVGPKSDLGKYSLRYWAGRCILRVWVAGDEESRVIDKLLHNNHPKVGKRRD